MAQNPTLQFESAFIEEAVFLAMRAAGKNILPDPSMISSFHQSREKIYEEKQELEERDRKFQDLYREFFERIGFWETFNKITQEFPVLQTSQITIFIKRVWSKQEEDSELYISGSKKTVFLCLRITSVLNQVFLEAFLRHELMRISDMLDVHFAYSCDIEIGGKSEVEDNLIRDRFRVLWDIYIDSRLQKNGRVSTATLQKQLDQLERIFFSRDDLEKKEFFDRLTDGKLFTQKELVDFAANNSSQKTLQNGGLCCPLCGFSYYECINEKSLDKNMIIKEIKKDYPDWNISMGLCRQCFDMYLSRRRVNL